MTWPHILSLSRVLAGPLVAALVLLPRGNAYLIAAAVFALASVTDLLDGRLARHSEGVSDLGVFLDTTADKILVGLTLVAMTLSGLTPAWIPLVILGREFLISGLRSYAASCDRVISAHIWGKGKAAVTMIAIVVVLLVADGRYGGAFASALSAGKWHTLFDAAGWLLSLSVVLTVISGLRYVMDARDLLVEKPARRRPAEDRRHVVAGGDKAV